ncbi:beta-propeller fold lactonase family protein [Rhodoferax sp.]|uniref:beta-propeller fold lactonase family protein n=1 Tax=Rhodoferax sp. TaxID=50421 RepID=UPI00374D3367
MHALTRSGLRQPEVFPVFYGPTPTDSIRNASNTYSLINSVEFHPRENLFCAAFTTVNKLILMKVTQQGKLKTVQVIGNPTAALAEPQHAVFSQDGNKIIAVNWDNATFTIYERLPDGLYASKPVAVIPFPPELKDYKPHGIEISPSGEFLAVAFGVTTRHKKGLALFKYHHAESRLQLLNLIEEAQLPGIPKGIAFSPDESCLLVTFSNINSISVYDLDWAAGAIKVAPRQVFQGALTGLSRPEDIKISAEGDHLIVSNSGANTVTCYHFDKSSNSIGEETPYYILDNPNARIRFPHGISLSADGSVLAITQFGPLEEKDDGNIVFGHRTPRRQAKINIYRREHTRPVFSTGWKSTLSSLLHRLTR